MQKHWYCTVFIPLLFLFSCSNIQSKKDTEAFEKGYSTIEKFGANLTDLHKLEALYKKHPYIDNNSRFKYYNYCCSYYHLRAINDTIALRYTDSMLLVAARANKADASNLLALANMYKGDILNSLKRYNEAYQYFYQGKIEAEKSEDACNESEYNYRLGMITYQRNKFEDAANFFVQTYLQSAACDADFVHFYRRQEVINNAALSYIHCNKPDSALKYYYMGMQYIEDNAARFPGKQIHIATAKAVMYGSAAEAYLQKHDVRGEEFYKKCIAASISLNTENSNTLEMQLKLAAFYLDSTFKLNLPQAKQVLAAARRGLDTLGALPLQMEWHLLMSKYENSVNNTAAAYGYITQYLSLRNKQRIQLIKLSRTDISEQMHLMQDKYDMEILKRNNALDKTYMYISWVLIALAAIILYQVVSSWKKSKNHVTELTVLNEKLNVKSEKLERALAELDKKNAEKDYIMRVVAHDLRNPVAAVSTLSRVIKSEYENEADNKEYLDLIQNACTESLELISNILQLDAQNRPAALRKTMFNVNETIYDCTQLLRMKAAEKKQQLIAELDETPMLVEADAEKVTHIINNLVVNAIKFSHSGSNITIGAAHNKNGHVVISVADKGIGIPDSMKALVFNVFTEAKRKGTAKETTFGLGLSICKQFVEAHGGKIWFDSKENDGTTFFVSLPGQPVPKIAERYQTEFA